MYFSDYVNCHWDLMDVLIEFDELQKYSEFLESHLEWPKRIELQKIKGIEDFQEHIQAIDSIEHKYSVILPTRFSYSYIIQFCSTLEWALEKILKIKIHDQKFKLDKNKGKVIQYLEYIDEKLNVKINNIDEVNKIIMARNLIAHSNGRLDKSKLGNWNDSSLYSPIEIFGEYILQINNKEFFRIYLDSRSWLVQCCSP